MRGVTKTSSSLRESVDLGSFLNAFPITGMRWRYGIRLCRLALGDRVDATENQRLAVLHEGLRLRLTFLAIAGEPVGVGTVPSGAFRVTSISMMMLSSAVMCGVTIERSARRR